MHRISILLLLILLLPWKGGFAGTINPPPDSISGSDHTTSSERPEPYHRNVIKLNPTPMLLWSNVRNLTLSYERLFRKNMSLGIQAGYLVFPKIISDTVAGLITVSGGKKYGVNLAFDYRYYPFARNRRPAPDGLYLGGFVSYYGFNFSNKLDVLGTDIDQNGSIDGRLNVVNLGFSLGYQFIFWKRVSLDLLMFGPAYSYYKGNLGIAGDLDPGDIEEIDQELVNALLERYPLLGVLFSQQKLEFNGTKSKFAVGFRYSIQLGFHF